jgi:serine/threonine protein phosphatase PrpC
VAVALRYAARSDVGLLRKNNQDSGYAGPHLLVVADGMGGAAGGDVASSVVVGHLAPLDDEAVSGDLLARLKEAVHAAHEELLERVAADPSLAGLGTTVVALLRSGNRLAMIHIGDSRAYLVRDDELIQVTTDHTFVQHLVEAGRITPEEAEHHPQRSVLLRVLGDNESDIVLDEWIHEARVGDRWLLCSDGLSGVVSAETIGYVLRTVRDVDACADTLVALALRGGGPDNITCIVADVLDLAALPDGTAPGHAPQAVGAASGRSRRSSRGTGAAGRAAALAVTEGEAEEDHRDELVDRRPSRGRTAFVWLLGTLVVVVVVAGLTFAGYRWSQTQYYVGVDGGYVAVFRGIPQDVGPLRLSRVHERSDVRVRELPPFARQRLEELIAVGSLREAREIVDLLAEEVPVEPEPEPGTTLTPTPSPGDLEGLTA